MKIFYALLVTATTIACSEQKFKGSTANKNPASGSHHVQKAMQPLKIRKQL